MSIEPGTVCPEAEGGEGEPEVSIERGSEWYGIELVIGVDAATDDRDAALETLGEILESIIVRPDVLACSGEVGKPGLPMGEAAKESPR